MTADWKPGSAAAWTAAGDDLTVEAPPPDERYSRGGELGRGGMGVVHAASDAWLEREVAVKRPHADLSEAQRSRLMREARITARLSHPGIVPIYDVGLDERGPFYTMPVLVGRTLEEHIATERLSSLVRAMASTCRAVAYAHRHGVVHRDLKPANILLGGFGEVWVLDWGVALDPDEPDASVVGTPGFQSPEQRQGATIGPTADVWSLGATLKHVLERHPPQPELEAVARRCCAADPAARYADAGELAEELERWLDGHRVSAHDYSLGEVLQRNARRYRAPLAVAGLAAVALAVLGAVSFRNTAIERDRALAAEAESATARKLADASLSVSLAQQAQGLRTLGVRPEAEVLAARSLEFADNPLARGVLMAWHGTARPALLERGPAPCPHAILVRGGAFVCPGETLSLRDAEGAVRWSSAAPLPVLPDVDYVGSYRDARLYDDGTLLLARAPHVLEVWRGSERVYAGAPGTDYLRLADGDIPAVIDSRRVGVVDGASGSITWSEPTCDQTELAWVGSQGTLVGCRGPSVWLGRTPEKLTSEPVPGSPSAATWTTDGPVVGTFEGDLLGRVESGWTALDAEVGGIRALVALPRGRVAALGERSRARVWMLADRALVAVLPGRAGSIVRRGDGLTALGEELRRYSLPHKLDPVSFDRSADGGLSFLDVSPSGQRILAGSADGDVVLWQRSGQARRLNAPGGTIARAGAMPTETEARFYSMETGHVVVDLPNSTGRAITQASGRRMVSYDAGVAMLSYLPRVDFFTSGPKRSVALLAPATDMTRSRPFWITDQQGGVSRVGDEGAQLQFRLDPPARAIAHMQDDLVALQGADVVRISTAGDVVWRWTGSAGATAMDATDELVVVGDGDGRVTVLSNEGRELASIVGHERLVSDVRIRGDVAFTGSWDGFARRWGLGAATADRTAVADPLAAAWGLDVDAALDGVGAL